MLEWLKRKAPQAPTSGEISAITAAAVEDVKAKWIQFDSDIRMKGDVPLSSKMGAFVEAIPRFLERKYPTLTAGGPKIFWLAVFTAILESGTHPTDQVNAAIAELKQSYGPRA